MLKRSPPASACALSLYAAIAELNEEDRNEFSEWVSAIADCNEIEPGEIYKPSSDCTPIRFLKKKPKHGCLKELSGSSRLYKEGARAVLLAEEFTNPESKLGQLVLTLVSSTAKDTHVGSDFAIAFATGTMIVGGVFENDVEVAGTFVVWVPAGSHDGSLILTMEGHSLIYSTGVGNKPMSEFTDLISHRVK